jgi:hypothetical protein
VTTYLEKYIYCLRCLTWVETDKPHLYMGRYKATCTDEGELDLSIFKAQGAWPQTRLDKSAPYADTKADVMEKLDD